MAERILGAVIAGGQARRFGSDKALVLLDGEPLIAHAAAQIAPFVSDRVVCGREWNGLPMLADLPGPGLGPLGGIAAALSHAAEHEFAAVLTIACDMPVVPAMLVEALVARRPSYCGEAPVLGCWSVDALSDLLTLLCAPAKAGAQSGSPPSRGRKQRQLSIRRWADLIGATPVPSPAPLANINTPADLA